MSDSRGYQRGYARPAAARPARATELERRSHAAIPVAVALVLIGLYLGRFTFVAPAAFGVVLLLAGISFLSTRINPLSPHFYLTRKPSWLATGIVFLGALALLAYAYSLFVHQFGTGFPR